MERAFDGPFAKVPKVRTPSLPRDTEEGERVVQLLAHTCPFAVTSSVAPVVYYDRLHLSSPAFPLALRTPPYVSEMVYRRVSVTYCPRVERGSKVATNDVAGAGASCWCMLRILSGLPETI